MISNTLSKSIFLYSILILLSLSILTGCQENETIEKKKGESTPSGIPLDCTSWFNGCNSCVAQNGQILACTEKYCPPEEYEEERCTAWKNNSDE